MDDSTSPPAPVVHDRRAPEGDREGDPHAIRRRRFVAVSLLAGATAALPACAGQEDAMADPGELPDLVRDLGPGTAIDRWTIVAVHPVRHGAIPVVLATADGERFQVDIMARDPAMPGVADGERFSLFVANAGDGRQATDEEQGLGAIALAEVLRERERDGATAPSLWTMAERTRRGPDGVFRVPLG